MVYALIFNKILNFREFFHILFRINNFHVQKQQENSILDNVEKLSQYQDLRLYKISIFGNNYIEAIRIEHSINNVRFLKKYS